MLEAPLKPPSSPLQAPLKPPSRWSPLQAPFKPPWSLPNVKPPSTFRPSSPPPLAPRPFKPPWRGLLKGGPRNKPPWPSSPLLPPLCVAASRIWSKVICAMGCCFPDRSRGARGLLQIYQYFQEFNTTNHKNRCLRSPQTSKTRTQFLTLDKLDPHHLSVVLLSSLTVCLSNLWLPSSPSLSPLALSIGVSCIRRRAARAVGLNPASKNWPSSPTCVSHFLGCEQYYGDMILRTYNKMIGIFRVVIKKRCSVTAWRVVVICMV